MPSHHSPNIELRSEKARKVIGQIPSSLVRYGNVALLFALCTMAVVAFFLPYQQVCHAEAIVVAPKAIPSDSADVTLQLKFSDKQPTTFISSSPPHTSSTLQLSTSHGVIVGQLQTLSATRDSLGRQIAIVRCRTNDIASCFSQTFDATLIIHRGRLLHAILGQAH